jgi:hypothetical protein
MEGRVVLLPRVLLELPLVGVPDSGLPLRDVVQYGLEHGTAGVVWVDEFAFFA